MRRFSGGSKFDSEVIGERDTVVKIMFAVATYWPFQDGVSHVTQYLAEGLVSKGHEVFVYTGLGNKKAGNLPRSETHNGVRIERIDVFVRWPLIIRGQNRESSAKAYYKRILLYRPDALIAVCAQTWPLDWLIPYLDRITCPKVFYSHGYSHLKEKYSIKEELKKRNVAGAWIEYKKRRYYKNLYRAIAKFDLAVYLQEENNAFAYAGRHGLRNGKVLENAVEDIFFSDSMMHSKRTEEKIRFLCVANYNDNKNQQMILRAFCRADMENAGLVFAGSEENEYLERLRNYWEEHRREGENKQVAFCVRLDRSKIYDLYRESDVFVCASKSENAPIVHREAAAAGMAVVSTPVGNVEKMDGILIAEDEEKMRTAMERLSQNREEIYERGKRLRQYAVKKGCRISDKVDWLERELRRL